jgi:hypothetical protein
LADCRIKPARFWTPYSVLLLLLQLQTKPLVGKYFESPGLYYDDTGFEGKYRPCQQVDKNGRARNNVSSY